MLLLETVLALLGLLAFLENSIIQVFCNVKYAFVEHLHQRYKCYTMLLLWAVLIQATIKPLKVTLCNFCSTVSTVAATACNVIMLARFDLNAKQKGFFFCSAVFNISSFK